MPWTNPLQSLQRGHAAERKAQEYLSAQGLNFVARNFHCRRGEIDLIMREHNTLVFVEVKYRRQAAYGSAVEYFDHNKRRKMCAAIDMYLSKHHLNPASTALRIDVVAIDGERVTWLKNV